MYVFIKFCKIFTFFQTKYPGNEFFKMQSENINFFVVSLLAIEPTNLSDLFAIDLHQLTRHRDKVFKFFNFFVGCTIKSETFPLQLPISS